MIDLLVFIILIILFIALFCYKKEAVTVLYDEFKDVKVMAFYLQHNYETLANHLCNVLEQLYAGFSEEDEQGVFRTAYNYDAAAVQFLSDIGYVEIIYGVWPGTKYITFRFTELRKEIE